MSIFKKQVAPEPEVITGTRPIQLRLWSRWKKANLSRTSLDLNISLAQLEAFAKNEIDRLPTAQMHLLCKEFYPYHTAFDPEKDILVDTSPPPAKGGTPPEPYKNPNPAIQQAHDAYLAALKAARPSRRRPGRRSRPSRTG